MKLRIKGNSVRLRLTQSEVNAIIETGKCEDQCAFVSNKLVYSVERGNVVKVFMTFDSEKISVIIPDELALSWAKSDQTSIGSMELNDEGQMINLSIEKDFACLNPRRGEDESDNFPNPLGAHNC